MEQEEIHYPTPDRTENESNENQGPETGEGEGVDDEIELASNPERIKDVDLDSLPGMLDSITNSRAVRTMIRNESNSDNPRSEIIKKLEYHEREL